MQEHCLQQQQQQHCQPCLLERLLLVQIRHRCTGRGRPYRFSAGRCIVACLRMATAQQQAGSTCANEWHRELPTHCFTKKAANDTGRRRFNTAPSAPVPVRVAKTVTTATSSNSALVRHLSVHTCITAPSVHRHILESTLMMTSPGLQAMGYMLQCNAQLLNCSPEQRHHLPRGCIKAH